MLNCEADEDQPLNYLTRVDCLTWVKRCKSHRHRKTALSFMLGAGLVAKVISRPAGFS